ncbi:plasmid partitioning protein RepB [uncultured Jannaschia sp.]|uniref:plasmid partitioning protein RepB n=1 Tax=uncultured Jannaschia sp. TaxID=293347 RepID=UPI00262DDEF8|nr:plasmid partitioning protein RepB [uncultured Jannaschia sp.]
MSDSRKRRMSMLDGLAAAGSPLPAPEAAAPGAMAASNRALRSARDAVDAHRVWDLDPYAIVDDRIADRLEPEDVADLRDAIEANGQVVPILVRRHPSDADRYLLVYGRRRLEAVRSSDKVTKVRALVASLDDDAAVRAQVSENMARRDLSFIEKALFARELVRSGFGTQTEVAEVLTVAKSAISMALTILEMVGPDLAQAIGPAHGIGRPRWDALGRAVAETGADRAELIDLAERVQTDIAVAPALSGAVADAPDPSVAAFEAVLRAVTRPAKRPVRKPKKQIKSLKLQGKRAATLQRSDTALRLDVENGPFADWLEAEAQTILTDLHARWTRRAED